MPTEEGSRVTKCSDGNVGLDFPKKNRTGVRDLRIICIEVTEMVAQWTLLEKGR